MRSHPPHSYLGAFVIVHNLLSEVGDEVPAHWHIGAHISHCVTGRVRLEVTRDGREGAGEISAGRYTDIPGGCLHGMRALEPNTSVDCIWTAEDFAREQAKGGCIGRTAD